MGKPTGFMEFERVNTGNRAPAERIGDWNEFLVQINDDNLKDQGARCMNCGVPFCHTGENIGRMTAGLPSEQSNSRVESFGLRRQVERSNPATCMRPTTFQSSPVASALPRAKALACWVLMKIR